MSVISRAESSRQRLLLLLGIALAAIIVGCVAIVLYTQDKAPEASSIPAARSDTVSGKAGGEGSREYNGMLDAHNDQQATAALKAGQSFVPTPVGGKTPVVGRKEETKPAPPPVTPVRTVPVRQPQSNDAMLKRMMDDLAALDSKLSAVSVGTGQITYLKDFSKDKAEVPPQEKPSSTTSPAASFPALEIRPGDLLYAVVDTGVNSDVPSAVMATVAAGKYKNARLLGGFQRHDKRLVLAFNRVVLPSGETIQLEGYAVDPGTSEASVASRVDTHFFSRWGGLIASAFLEGLGTAKRYSGAQSTTYGTYGESTDQMVWNSYSLEDQAWIAAGKVGEKAGKIFEEGFDRPPTVYLASGTAIGVLVLNVKDR